MSMITAPPLMTTEELLALPDNGMERMLIRGQLIEWPMSRRSPKHCKSTTNTAYFLKAWLLLQPKPRGDVLTGEAGFRIRRNPDTTVGIDLAYISPELAAATPDNARLVEGVPVLGVEILSPSNRWENITQKVRDYLDVGVPATWVLDPVFRTVQIYRPGSEPVMLNSLEELSGDPYLPGFRVPVVALFDA